MSNLSDLNYMDSYNAIVGSVVTLLTMVLGEHWILFALFLLFNVIDFITGWMKARITKKENSIKGFKGVIKKLGYWLIILVSFSTSLLFVEIGEVLEINLSITTMLGWFVLASLAINEVRSIIENIVECGYKVPVILIKGLDIASRVINKKEDDEDVKY
ncbi:phage holin family protein [Thomasclavelia sp.]|uniref:phage holin family protein n=1 Tax=Thomasclavelia sp. TaxID=3025757 RepID=UPI002607E9EC|nr:phage holin family protein [Thomasclavelia sp.]